MGAPLDRLAKWFRRVTSDPAMTRDGERKCVALALLHVTAGIKSEVHSLKLGAKVWEPEKLAEMFDGIATEHAAGLSSIESGSGQEMYHLVAFYEDLPDMAVAPLPLMKRTGVMSTADDSIVTEPPTPKGELSQNMRERSAWMQFVLEMTMRTHAAQAQTIDAQARELANLRQESHDVIQTAKEMILEKASDAHDHRMKELAFERSSEERSRLMKLLPGLANKITGREIFPESTVDSSLFEALLESADEKQIERILAAVMPVLKPEQQALLFGRLAEIQERMNAKKAKAAATANGNGTVKS